MNEKIDKLENKSNLILKVEKITKVFTGTIALNEVDFELRKGEVHAIVGENGAGKSTLMKILSGAYIKTSGNIYIDGEEVEIGNVYNSNKLGISMIYQELENIPKISVAENIFNQKKVDDFYKWLEREFKCINAKKEAIDAQIRMYFALRDHIIEKDYDFIAVKCLPELPYVYTTFCLAHSLLNDSSDDGFGNKSPFVAACEADSNAALTMQILKNISNRTTLFTDILYMDYEKSLATMGNCGSQPTDFAKSRKDVCWVNEGFIGHDFIIGCACPRYIGKEGKVTISRLTRVNGTYQMLITKGDVLSLNLKPVEEAGSKQHPKLFIRLDCDNRDFVRSLRTNHLHIVYGDFTEELKITCDILGFNRILPI